MKEPFISYLKKDPEFSEVIRSVLELPEVTPEKAEIGGIFHSDLSKALKETGFSSLYTHQIEAFENLYKGNNILVSTPTGSGKSLIYQLFAIDSFLKNKKRKFLFIYPYKALAQDQLAKLNELTAKLGISEFRAEIYDGDTTPYKRKKIQQNPPNVIMTNPEMLHLSFLAYRENWKDWLDNLYLVSIDEAHIYRGIFGANVHHLFWRLKRLVPSNIFWIGTSATIGEGKRFFEKLIGEEVVSIQKSGAPRPKRNLCILQPKGSPYTLACFLMEKLLEKEKRTVTFTKARRITELVYNWLINRNPKYRKLVSSYRAGFLPSERRKIEQNFFDGTLLGVVSTSAMEAGIDIGNLDACILIGFPGSLVSLYQRMGRVGRGQTPADIFLITMPDALDQYYLSHPQELLTREIEEPILDPYNDYITEGHILCAAKEMPLNDCDYPPSHPLRKAIDLLDEKGRLILDESGTRWHTLSRNPHREINFRSIGESFEIVDENEKTIGNIDGVRVYRECHEGAVYLHQGQSYEVEKISEKQKRVYVKLSFSDHYTEVRSEKETEILEILEEKKFPAFRLCFARVKVRERVIGFIKKKLFSGETIAEYPLDTPPIIFETESVFMVIPSEVTESLIENKLHTMGSYHAVEHAIIAVFPLLALADRWDIGGISYELYPSFNSPAIFIYDGIPGGAGISKKGFEEMEKLLSTTLSLILSCECEEGCPSCVQSPKCGNGNRPLDKDGASFVLKTLLNKEEIFQKSAFQPKLPSVKPIIKEPLKKVVFDLETKFLAEEVGGWDKIDKLGLALAVLWDLENDRWLTFLEKDAEDLIDAIFSAELVIGFNSKRFDYKVLEKYSNRDFSLVKSYDILEKIKFSLGFRISLDDLAFINLGERKTSDGFESVKWFREGRIDLVESYCKKDVELTGKLYLKATTDGFLLFKSRSGEILRINTKKWNQ